jgi:A/G-specific adenine glycosylase
MLKTIRGFSNNQSRHYVKQSRFEGSRRQLRGAILSLLINNGSLSQDTVATVTDRQKSEVYKVFLQLKKEAIVCEQNGRWFIQNS